MLVKIQRDAFKKSKDKMKLKYLIDQKESKKEQKNRWYK